MSCSRDSSGKCGSVSDIKTEIKSETMDVGREESTTIKEEPMTPSTQMGEDTKPSFKIEPIAPSSTDKKPKCPCPCRKFSFFSYFHRGKIFILGVIFFFFLF